MAPGNDRVTPSSPLIDEERGHPSGDGPFLNAKAFSVRRIRRLAALGRTWGNPLALGER
jgi:hypothetical protein